MGGCRVSSVRFPLLHAKFTLPIKLIAIKHFRAARSLRITGADRIKPPRMTDALHTAVTLRRPRRESMFMSPRVRDLLDQAERAFRLAMTNRADAEWLEQIAQSFLERARRVADEEGGE